MPLLYTRMSDEQPLSQGDRQISEWLFILTFVVCAYFYAGGGWNQNSQFDLTRAIVERHTFAIDAYAGNTGDVARHDGRTYSNKSPGLSWLGAIPYAVIYAVESHNGIDPSSARVWALNCYLCTVAVVAPLAALIPALLFIEARRRGLSAPWAAAVGLAVALATELWPYSTFFVLHVPSGALALVALRTRRAPLAGFFAAAATVVNYLFAPAIVLFALIRRRRDALMFLAGAVPPLLLLAAYQHICFGRLTTISIAREDPRFLAKGAVMGVFGPPNLDALRGITISPYRGLFYFAPVLLLAVAGFVVWLCGGWREFRTTDGGVAAFVDLLGEPLAILAVTTVFFGFNVMFINWEGGFGVGARYLVPIIPLWGLAMLRCHGWQKPLFIALAVVSSAINFTATAVDPQPSATIPRPLTQYLVPLLIDGHFSSDVPITRPWSAATFTGHTSVNRMTHDEPVVFFRHPPGSPEAEWASFNLGEPLFGAGDARSLIPIAAILALGAAAILWKARQVQRASEAT
jgi:hypothetical protein